MNDNEYRYSAEEVIEMLQRVYTETIISKYFLPLLEECKTRKILAINSKGESITFPTIEEASKYTRISTYRIRYCIQSGTKWKTWMFDEV